MPFMDTRSLAKKAIKMAGRPEIYNVTVANTYTNWTISDVAVHNLMANFTTSATEQGDGNFAGNKIFIKNVEWTMHFNAEAITQTTLDGAVAQYIKPLWITIVIFQSFFSPLQNRTSTSNAILESLVDPVNSKYTPSTSENYLGKYKILHREDVKMAGIVNPEEDTAASFKPALTPTGKIGEGQYLRKGSIAINKLVKFQPDNDPSVGLKCIVITGNTVINSTIWGMDGASLFRIWYTDA